jgi:23S rRNA (cytosine1962-C5)-methyltransferase
LSDSLFRSALRYAIHRRAPLRESNNTNAYRIFHADADGVPGVTVDWFDGVGVVSLYVSWDERTEREWIEALAQLQPLSVYLKRRPRQASRIAQLDAQALAPRQPAFGQPVAERIILENGLRFLIRPALGLASGLYLDMRDTRKWLRGEVRSRRVLNCFAYTCGFGVCARAGGADRVVNVDISLRALEWGQQNARLNGQAVAGEDYLCGDVFDWLRRFRKRQERFDFVVLDPPSFATAKGSKFTASSDWPRLISLASPVVDHAGTLLACCNQASLALERFERMLRRGFDTASRSATLVQQLGASKLDFPNLPAKRDSLKVLAYRLD